MTPNVNVLIAVSRDEHVLHLKAQDWLLEAARNRQQRVPAQGSPVEHCN